MFSVTHEGNDISDYIISFERNIQICTGIGTLDLVVSKDFPDSFTTWDTILLYESGIKKGTFNISTIVRASETGGYSVSCQDNSKRLVDYFITDFYEINYLSYSKYWIELFLNAAGVDYVFTVGGISEPMSENTSIGLGSAYDIIIPLLQMNGWYMYFNKDGICIIGNLNRDLNSPSHTFTDDEILNIKKQTDDKMLRNRAVVWGNYDLITGSTVFADVSINTEWNYSVLDKRAVVLSNSGVRNSAQALSLANQMLTEFAKITEIISLEIAGYYNIDIGDIIRVNSDYISKNCLLTTLSTKGSSSGFITSLTLDERCPRLFGFFSQEEGYVYIGTSGNGVWRKPLNGSTWSDFSIGLPSGCSIDDMYINNNIFGIVTASGDMYYRNISTNWTPVYVSGLLDENNYFWPASGIRAKKITINHNTDHILTGYIADLTKRSWVVESDFIGNITRTDLIYQNSGYDVVLKDLDTNDISNFIVAEDETPADVVNLGIRSNSPHINQDNSYVILPESLNQHVIKNIDYVSSATSFSSGGWTYPIVQTFGTNRIYSYHIKVVSITQTAYRVKYNITWNGSSWTISQSQTSVSLGQISFSLPNTRYFYKTINNDDILYATVISTSNDNTTIYFSHYEIDFFNNTFTSDDSQTFDRDGYYPLSSPKQRENYIWQVFYKINGGQVDIKYFKYDQISKAITIDHYSESFTDITPLTLEDLTEQGSSQKPIFSIKLNNTGFIWAFTFRAVNSSLGGRVMQAGLIYGDESQILKYTTWYRPGDIWDTAGFVCVEQMASFAGDIGTSLTGTTHVVLAFTLRLNAYTGDYYGYTAKYHIDTELSISHLDEHQVFSNLPDFSTWFLRDFMIHSAGTSADVLGFRAVTSKHLITPYFLQNDDELSYRRVRVVSLPDFNVIRTLGTSSQNIDITGMSNQVDSDFNNTIYLGIQPAGFLAQILGAYSLDTGNLIHIYDNITTTSNVFAYAANGFIVKGVSDAEFMWPNAGYWYIPGDISVVIEQTNLGCSDVLHSQYKGYQLDIAKQTPIEVFPITLSGLPYPVYQSYSGGIFSAINKDFGSLDGRVFDFTNVSGITLASGIIIGSGVQRYFGMATYLGLSAFNVNNYTSPSGFITITLISGVNKFEASRNTPNPYFFLSVSGVSQSGSRFLQKNPDSTIFTDYSSGIPNSEITVIRLDDII